MPRDESPPFGRGETFYNGSTINASDLGGAQHEGKEWEFEDLDYSVQGSKPARSNRMVTCRCLRNVSGIALLPKRLAALKKSGVNYGAQADGYVRLTADRVGGVVDEWLPAAGVPNNDLFWAVVKGPTRVLTDIASGANNVFNIGDVLVSLTAATSQATTAGRVAPQDLSGATSLLGNQIQNLLGYALSAQTTANTNNDLLTEVLSQY